MLDRQLLQMLGKDKTKLVYLTLLRVANLFLQVFAVAILCMVAKQIVVDANYASVVWLLLPLLFISCKFALNYVVGRLECNLGDVVQKKLRLLFFGKILQNKGLVAGYNSAALANLGLEGIEQLNLYYVTYIPQFFYSLISPLLLFVVFCFIHFPTAIVFLVCVPLIPVSIVLVSKYAKKIFNKYWDKYLSMGGDFLDNLKGIRELKLFAYDDVAQDKMDDSAEEFRKITMKVLVMQLYSTSIMDFIAFGGSAIGMAVAILSLVAGGISSPFLLLFIVVVGAEFFLPMRALGSAFHISMNGMTAGHKIMDILSLQDKQEGDVVVDKINKVTIDNLSVSYGDKTALNNFSLDICQNGLYAIVGSSGSGKSTLVKALSKCVDVPNQQIKINDVCINQIDGKSFYDRACFISYESHVFIKTVYDNFKFINPDVTPEQMRRALDMVKLNHVDLSFEFKENATNVSGGEKQRFVLAFYLTKSYDFYVFDEATSNIDSDSEQIIMDYIKKLSQKNKVLLITHRLKNTIGATCVCYLKEGNVQEKGEFANLVKQNGIYNKMLLLQQKMEEGLVDEDDIKIANIG